METRHEFLPIAIAGDSFMTVGHALPWTGGVRGAGGLDDKPEHLGVPSHVLHLLVLRAIDLLSELTKSVTPSLLLLLALRADDLGPGGVRVKG